MTPTSPRALRTLRVAAACALAFGLLLGAASPAPVAAQEARPDARAVEAARAMADRRATPREVASAMASSYRQTPAQTAAVLRAIRIGVRAVGEAVVSTYRLRGGDAVTALVSGGFPSLDAVTALDASGVTPAEAASGLFRADVPAVEMVRTVKEVYDGRPTREVREALRGSGYTFEAPGNLNYWITDYRSPGSGRIENFGIVDPRYTPGSGHPADGLVTIEGPGLDLPGTRVTIVHEGGITEGEIVAARGGPGLHELEVTFQDFGSGELVVETPGGETAMPVLQLAHVTLTVPQIFDPLPVCAFTGSQAAVEWNFVPGSSSSPDFSPESDRLDIAVNGAGEGVLAVSNDRDAALTLAFSQQVNLTGHLIPVISHWSCDSFQIEVAVCSPLTASCIASEIAVDAAESLFRCADPENWKQVEIDGPPIPIQGQGGLTLTLASRLGVAPDGTVLARPLSPGYSGDVWNTIPLPPAEVPFTLAELWWDDTVVPAIRELNDPFTDALAKRLNEWPQFLSGMYGRGVELLGVYGQPDGSLLFDFRR